jgi:hypothetical protein
MVDDCSELKATVATLQAELASVSAQLAAKRAEALAPAAAINPLDNNSTLDLMFSMLGPKHYLYVAGVNRQWRGVYMKHSALKTSHKTALASVSTLKHATKHAGLNMNDAARSFSWSAFKHGSPEVVEWAQQNGTCSAYSISWTSTSTC